MHSSHGRHRTLDNGSGNGLLEFSEFVSKVMPPDYTEKSWNIIRDEEAIARMEATRQAVLAESPFHSKPRATAKASTSARDAALSMRTDESTFEEADLEELMTPLPKEVLQRGMCVLLCPSWSCHHHRALSRLLVARPPQGRTQAHQEHAADQEACIWQARSRQERQTQS